MKEYKTFSDIPPRNFTEMVPITEIPDTPRKIAEEYGLSGYESKLASDIETYASQKALEVAKLVLTEAAKRTECGLNFHADKLDGRIAVQEHNFEFITDSIKSIDLTKFL